MAAFKKLKLVDEHELEQLIEKQIRQYDPRIRSMALLEKEMGSALNRDDLAPEEKLALFKSAQHRYDKMNRIGMDSSEAVIVHPDAVQREDIEPIEEGAPGKRREDLAQQEGDSEGELRKDEPEENAAGDQEDYNVAPLKFNDFEDQLHPRYHDKAKNLINLIEKHSTVIAFNPHSREVILDGRTIPHSSIFDLIKSLYEGKEKAKYLNLHGEKEFLSKIAKVFDKAGIEKTGKFISKREKVNLISSKRAQIGKGRTRRPRLLNPQLHHASNTFQKNSPPGKAIKVLYLY